MKYFVRQNATVELEIYKNSKYSGTVEDGKTVKYNGVNYWEIIHGDAAAQLEAETDGSCIDDLHEYLVLHFEDGESAAFRNSYVDMFIF